MAIRNSSWSSLFLGSCIAVLSIGMGHSPASRACFTLKAVRPAGVGDRAITDRNLFLRESDDPNNVPGPAGTRLVVRKDARRKPVLYLEDPHGPSTLVLQHATGPRVSPEGRYVACAVWRSIHRPWTLVVVDLRTKHSFEPSLDGCSTPYAWSPDGKLLAVMVTPCQEEKARLALVEIPSGRARWIDSLEVFSDYEFSWSPDSKWLAVVRPTQIDRSTEEPTAADVWFIGAAGQRCRLATPQYVEHEPHWIGVAALVVDRYRVVGTRLETPERVVYQLQEETHP
jgi:WD40 repeat protein